MRMSVTPKEIARHLVEEQGHQQAVETYKHHLSRCHDTETREIWESIGSEMLNLSIPKQH